jgi:tetraacyldisaccharide 4'-kinase
VNTLHRPLVLVLARYKSHQHQSTWESVQSAFPAAMVRRAAFALSHAVKYPGSQQVSLTALAPMSLVGLAGLARPEVFADSLRQVGINLKHFFSFPDHHAFAPAELAGLVAAARRLGAQGLITTEKDWMRLAGKWHADLPLYVAHLHVNLLDPWPLQLLPPGCAQKLRTP